MGFMVDPSKNKCLVVVILIPFNWYWVQNGEGVSDAGLEGEIK